MGFFSFSSPLGRRRQRIWTASWDFQSVSRFYLFLCLVRLKLGDGAKPPVDLPAVTETRKGTSGFRRDFKMRFKEVLLNSQLPLMLKLTQTTYS